MSRILTFSILRALFAAALLSAAAPALAQEPGGEGMQSFPPPLAAPPASAAAPRTGPPQHGSAPTFEEQILERVNQERQANGALPPLKGQTQLAAAAELHSTNMGTRNFFSHCDPDLMTMPGQRVTAAGYVWNSVGENAAAGQTTPQQVMAAWMGSAGHRSNILSTNFREIGVGYFLDAADAANVRMDLDSNCVHEGLDGPFFHYWTQDFGRRNDVYPVVIDREAFTTATRDVDLYLYGTGFAVEMRLRNEAGAFTAWMPFDATVAWQLSAAGGVKTVTAEIRNGATVRSASDTILLLGTAEVIFEDGFESGNTSAWSNAVP